jgi:hypothetical protein
MDLPAGEARDRLVVPGILRSVLRYKALNSTGPPWDLGRLSGRPFCLLGPAAVGCAGLWITFIPTVAVATKGVIVLFVLLGLPPGEQSSS